MTSDNSLVFLSQPFLPGVKSTPNNPPRLLRSRSRLHRKNKSASARIPPATQATAFNAPDKTTCKTGAKVQL